MSRKYSFITGGTPPRKSIATAKIEVLDVNDEFPQFLKAKYSATLKENLPPGQFVIQVTFFVAYTQRNLIIP